MLFLQQVRLSYGSEKFQKTHLNLAASFCCRNTLNVHCGQTDPNHTICNNLLQPTEVKLNVREIGVCFRVPEEVIRRSPTWDDSTAEATLLLLELIDIKPNKKGNVNFSKWMCNETTYIWQTAEIVQPHHTSTHLSPSKALGRKSSKFQKRVWAIGMLPANVALDKINSFPYPFIQHLYYFKHKRDLDWAWDSKTRDRTATFMCFTFFSWCILISLLKGL